MVRDSGQWTRALTANEAVQGAHKETGTGLGWTTPTTASGVEARQGSGKQCMAISRHERHKLEL